MSRDPGRDSSFTVKAIPGEDTTLVKFYEAAVGENTIMVFWGDKLIASRTITHE